MRIRDWSSDVCSSDLSHRLTVRPLGRFPVVYVEPVQRQGWRPVAKRAFDIVFAGLLMLLTAPVVAVSAVLIKITSPGPVLFRQERIGRNGEPFTVLKLRTMVRSEEHTSALQSLMRSSYAVFCLNKKKTTHYNDVDQKYR